MARTHPDIPFERYADDIICHCRSAEEAQCQSALKVGSSAASVQVVAVAGARGHIA